MSEQNVVEGVVEVEETPEPVVVSEEPELPSGPSTADVVGDVLGI